MFSVSQEKVIKIQVYFGSGSISAWFFQIPLNKTRLSHNRNFNTQTDKILYYDPGSYQFPNTSLITYND